MQPFATDWLDTAESQRLLRFQTRTLDDYVRDMSRLLGPRRVLVCGGSARWCARAVEAIAPLDATPGEAAQLTLAGQGRAGHRRIVGHWRGDGAAIGEARVSREVGGVAQRPAGTAGR